MRWSRIRKSQSTSTGTKWWSHFYRDKAPSPLPPRPDVGVRLGTQKGFFACYDPRKQQTVYTDFAWDYRQKHRQVGNGVLLNRSAAKKDLESRFDFVGRTDHMTESNCLLVIYYTGWVPPVCDCTPNDDLRTNTSTKMTMAMSTNRSNTNSSSKTKITNGNMTDVSFSHGVQHHGSSYETSPLEEHLLDELTRWDQLLYSVATDLFWQRLIETEYEYGIAICEVPYFKPMS